MSKITRHLNGRSWQLLINELAATFRFLKKRLIVKPYVNVRKYALAIVPFQRPARTPIAQKEPLPDYIVWGVIDWKFRHQRPQHLASELAAAGRRVFYISSNFQADHRAGFVAEDLNGLGNLYQVKLFLRRPQIIYFSTADQKAASQLCLDIGELLNWSKSTNVVSIVQHPFWYPVASSLPNNRVIYDCIDDHAGFGNSSDEVLALEDKLFRHADMTIVTSGKLKEMAAPRTDRVEVIRNAADYAFFSNHVETQYRDPEGRPVIGYYGAIANWFDLDLIASVAEHFPHCTVLLVGADTIGARAQLRHHANVRFVGEVEYGRLPFFLYAFDVCLVPFKIIPLTLATNPVKVYEYLSAGKPVVSVDLPEMAEFPELVHVAKNSEEFISRIADVLATPQSEPLVASRKQFAKRQTWKHRVADLIDFAEQTITEPLVSIVVVTFNNLDFTRRCLDSVVAHSGHSNLEVIVVDNASSDGSQAYLQNWQTSGPNRHVILNDDNRGFAAANNQGMAVATGDYLVLLNNDTVVTSGWVRTMLRHLKQHPDIGLLGPVTNNIGNEAKVDVAYKDLGDMHRVSADYTRSHIGQIFDLRTLAFFCVMLRRDVYERVGALDEIYGLGFFEDDDYCRRVQKLGLRVVCARDVFVHHHLSASFMKMDTKARRQLFARNKQIYEAKWGTWIPHRHRARRASWRKSLPLFGK
ncbi:glycosyltransferase [Paraburkholderia sp. J12]|uniref:glycosyltransferase n=1 Tax=Paraburkholderia sp. J12 TaxID=2805432 RepID=UPI002ABDC00D|nr:glycosyltransferase [Paraburkholderia sp. J12]